MDATEIIIVVVALAAGSFVKGLTGAGLPQIAIPVMAVFIGVEHAVIVLSIPGVVSNVWLVVLHARASPESRDLPVLIVAGTLGSVVGTILLTTVDARWLSLALAMMIIVYVAMRLRRPHMVVSPATSAWVSPPVGLASGALQGATGVSGPLLATYLYTFGLTSSAYIFSLASMFLILSIAQVVTLAALGAYSTVLLVEGLLALVPIAVMLPFGSWVSRRLPAQRFSHVIMASLTLAAIVLVWQALS